VWEPCAGWGFAKTGVKKRQQDGTLSYSIPYSEHSSWVELRECVRAFRPKKLIPTVNVTDTESFDRMIAKFADLMDLSESRKHIDRFFVVSPQPSKHPKSEAGSGVETGRIESMQGDAEQQSGSLKRCAPMLDAESYDECSIVNEGQPLKALKSCEEWSVEDAVLCEDCSQTIAEDVCEIFDV
jgi:hypothetical protein